MADYQNPQHEPGNERRLILIFVVTFVLMLVFVQVQKKYFPAPPPPQEQKQTSATPAPKETQPPAPPATTSKSKTSKSAKSKEEAPAPIINKQAAQQTDTVVENNLYRITFTNRGAEVKSWILKKYDNDSENGPLDLVNPAAAQQYGYPMSLWTYDEDLRGRLDSELYVPSATGTLKTPASLTFEYSDDVMTVRKTFTFDDSYIVKVDAAVTFHGSPAPALVSWPAGFGDETTPAFYASSTIDYQFNKNIERLAIKKISGGATIPGPFHWAGPNDQYFAAVFIPDDPANASMVTFRNALTVPRDPQNKNNKEQSKVEVLGAAVGNLHGPISERVFVGPKEPDILQTIAVPGLTGADNDLTGLVDYGIWGLLAKPLFVWLKWTYAHMVANWGWAIVLQTLIITLALMPLRFMQMRSMLKMQRVQPQIKSIQEKYKKYSLRDPRKAAMNEEISALYKKEGVNPVGGCLPMLIQLPFLYAYYKMLYVAIDLRHAHWLWIRDLSAADPLYLLPIFMVVTMIVTQRMTPQTGMDPAQQRMMNIMMPLFMGFIFFRLQAGLNLYYMESNLISIGQQAVINRTKLGREMREMMAKRARKKDK
ncbi:MAG TPA: membrane protein insertase YidC [Candidatus Sulfotelmatobacter sp.]|nr:membrane protein insertase YidC [Candidatus Sulfotelmatobacter sp.]